MKLLTGLFLFLAISSALAMPAGNPDDDAEYLPVSRRQQGVPRDYDSDVGPDFKDFKGVIDTGSGYPFFSLRPYNPESTGGFFDGFEGLLKRLRESVLNRWWSSIPTAADFDPSEGNTTSVVKVIDGHRVEINDTVYTKTDDFGNSVYKVRVVNIRPLESGEEPTTEGPGSHGSEDDKGSREELERGPQDNEVLGNIDSTEHVESHSPFTQEPLEEASRKRQSLNLKSNIQKIEEVDESDQEDESTTNVTTNSENSSEDTERRTLSTNTITHKEDSYEKFDEDTAPSYTRKESTEDNSEDYDGRDWENHNLEWEPYSIDNGKNNNIDTFDSIPVDLSNDIAVNDMLADQGAPFDPDAEVFAVDEFIPEYEKKRFHYEPIKSEDLRTNVNFDQIKNLAGAGANCEGETTCQRKPNRLYSSEGHWPQ